MLATAIAVHLLPLALAIAALLGLLAGSFIATLVLRWPRGERLVGRSRCDRCGARLGLLELVPLLGFAWRRGHCGHCGQPIDWRHPAIEASAAAIAMLAVAAAPGPLGAAGALFGWMLLAMGALDAEHYWLPDRLTLPFLGLGLVLGLGTFPERALGAALGGGALLLLRVGFERMTGREGLGLGDVKLMAGLGAWLSWVSLAPLLLLASLLGLGAAMFRLVQARRAGVASLGSAPAVAFGACLAAAAFPLWLYLVART
jgi:leader peptidase (prepilin peptidase)/N-methyltransferase